MPFTPLPATLIDDLSLRSYRGVLELGSGDGLLTGLLREQGVEPLTLDRRPQAAGARADICGDALRPPLRRTFGVVIAGNLLRHLWPDLGPRGPETWQALVAPGGCLWILEDQPLTEPAAARHYRDLQALLARLDVGGRGALLSQRRFQSSRRAWRWPGQWRSGQAQNCWPADPQRVCEWLAGGVPDPGGEVARLVAGIQNDGLSYGRYWWARWQPEEAA